MTRECTCPEDWKTILSEDRIVIENPGAVTIIKGKRVLDRSKVFVFSKKCDLHGYHEVTE